MKDIVYYLFYTTIILLVCFLTTYGYESFHYRTHRIGQHKIDLTIANFRYMEFDSRDVLDLGYS